MRKVLLGFGILAAAGCRIDRIDRDGPTPQPAGIVRSDAGFPVEPVLCSDLGGRISLSGQGFSPMPKGVLTDAPSVALPKIFLVAADGNRIELSDVSFDPATASLSATVPALAPQTYDVVVENPNGHSGTLAAALTIVPPPELTGVVPSSGPNNVTTDVVISGDHFRAASDGTQPTVELTPVTGGDASALGSVAVASAVEVDASVGPGLEIGWYDLTLTNPEGCSATLAMAFEVTVPPTIDLCGEVEPQFGWIGGRTTVEICADNAAGNGLQPVPEVFLLVDPDNDGEDVVEVPLIREAFVNGSVDRSDIGGPEDASVMTAVVPSADEERGLGLALPLVAGTRYDIRIVNPNGASGVILDAFELLDDPPPHITRISPEQDTVNGGAQELTIVGEHLKESNRRRDRPHPPRAARCERHYHVVRVHRWNPDDTGAACRGVHRGQVQRRHERRADR